VGFYLWVPVPVLLPVPVHVNENGVNCLVTGVGTGELFNGTGDGYLRVTVPVPAQED
jgi:hypothetical protein